MILGRDESSTSHFFNNRKQTVTEPFTGDAMSLIPGQLVQ